MKKIYTLIGGVLLTATSLAQAPYAGTAMKEFTSEKHQPNGITFIDMRDAANHYQNRVVFYNEDFDTGFNGWVPATQNGPVDFEITNVGHANDAGSTFVIPALFTSTPTNWVLWDSDSDGASGQQEDGTLTSPTIDLVALGAPVSGPYQLKVEFEQFYAGWQSDTLFLAVSDDNGATWDEVEIMNNSVGREGRPNPEIVSINISPYVVDATQIKLRFRWTGNWDYGWQFDNVTIAELPDNDMKVQKIFRGDLINSFMYSMVPDEQVIPFVIGAEVMNLGYLDQTNIAIDWEIFDPAMSSIGSGTSVATIALLANGEKDTIWINTGVTPSALGTYTIECTVVATATDDEPANNLKADTDFEVTDYVYGADYGSIGGAFSNWASNNDGAASIGNAFLIQQNGVIGGIEADLYNSTLFEGQLMYYQCKIWDGTAGDYIDISGGSTDDYTIMPGEGGTSVRLYFASPISVTAGDQILGLAGHYGGASAPAWNLAGQVSLGSVGGTLDDLSYTNLADPSAPAVRLLMIDFTEIDESVVEEKFSVYPNPATESINISMTLNESENTVINVLDITGKIVKSINIGNVNGDKNLTISLDDMTSGIYFVELVNATGIQVKKFVKK